MAWLFWFEFTAILIILTFWEDEDENEEEEEEKYDVKQHLPTKGIGCTFTAEDVREALKK
jgi:hypothetical protein